MLPKPWLWILLVAVILRTMAAFSMGPLGGSDVGHYYGTAQHFRETGVIRDPHTGFMGRTPILSHVIHAGALSLGELNGVRVLNVLIGSALVFFVMCWARQWHSEKQATLAGALVALSPWLIMEAHTMHSDGLALFFFWWAMICSGLWSGLLFGLALLVRPALLACFCFWLLFMWPQGKRVLWAAGLGLVLALIPQILFNKTVFESWHPFPTGGLVVWGFHLGLTEGSPALGELLRAHIFPPTPLDEIAFYQECARQSWGVLFDWSAERFGVITTNLKMLFDLRPLEGKVGFAPFLFEALCVFGFFSAWVRQRLSFKEKIAVLSFVALQILVGGEARYRLPIEPLLIVGCAGAFFKSKLR